MACIRLFTCDYQGCLRALDERDVSQVHLCVHGADMPQDPEMSLGLTLDLCEDHLDVVLARILTSAGSITG